MNSFPRTEKKNLRYLAWNCIFYSKIFSPELSYWLYEKPPHHICFKVIFSFFYIGMQILEATLFISEYILSDLFQYRVMISFCGYYTFKAFLEMCWRNSKDGLKFRSALRFLAVFCKEVWLKTLKRFLANLTLLWEKRVKGKGEKLLEFVW